MKYFSHNDEIWEETAAFLNPLVKQSTYVIAPDQFINVLPNIFSFDLLAHFTPDFFDFVVIHKGECQAIGRNSIEAWTRTYSPIFANSVFVIFSKQGMQEIDRSSDDYKSLINQLPGLPNEPLIKSNENTFSTNEDLIDYRPIIDFLNTTCSDNTLIMAPSNIRKIFPNSIDEQSLLKTSLDTVNYAVVSIATVLAIPYQDLKNMVENYTPIFSNQFFIVYLKQNEQGFKSSDKDFAEVLSTALQTDDYQTTLKLYRDLLLGKDKLSN